MVAALSTSRAELEKLLKLTAEIERREERALLEGSLSEFVEAAWPFFDGSSQYQQSWAIDALCEHLTAVTNGDIKRLLINFPPRAGKSSVVSIAWPAWTWVQQNRTYLSGPQVQFLCASYGHSLSLQLSNASRRLLMSPMFQHYWSDRFTLRGDQNAKHRYDNSEGGYRIATSVGGGILGVGGSCLIADDLHDTQGVESDADRETVLRFWREFRSTRLNDPQLAAIVAVMQRLNQMDVSGVILEDTEDWTHLMLPMRHDPSRHCVTVLKWDEKGNPAKTWEDPRDPNGVELMWPERFGEKEVRLMEKELGPFMASGRLQQSPEAQGGGIIKREWWQLWEAPKFPECKLRWACADTAYTEKEENDPTGFVVMGLFYDKRGDPKVMLLHAWRKRLEIHGPTKWTETNTQAERKAQVAEWRRIAQAYYKMHGSPEPTISPNVDPWLSYIETGENTSDRWPQEVAPVWEARTQEHWGLCEWIAHTCRRFKVHKLLVESKASGLSVVQELRRLHGGEGWDIIPKTPEGDKTARLYAVQGTFSAGMVYAPDRDWAQMCIDEISLFPKGRYRDLTDATSMALSYIRETGDLLRPTERALMDEMSAQYKTQKSAPLYPGVG